MKQSYIFILIAITLLYGCNSDNVSPTEMAQQRFSPIALTAVHYNPTKTTINSNINGYFVKWTTNDVIRLMRQEDDKTTAADLIIQNGENSQTATFVGQIEEPNPTATTTSYQAFYPASKNGNTPEEWKTNASYHGQTQQGENSTTHLPAYDYLISPIVENLTHDLPFFHQGNIFCFEISMPENIASIPQNLSITTVDEEGFPIENGGLYQNCNLSPTSSISLSFTKFEQEVLQFKAYLMVNCHLQQGQKIHVRLALQNGKYYFHELTIKKEIQSNLQGEYSNGNSYLIPISQWEEAPYDIFTAGITTEPGTDFTADAPTGSGDSPTTPYLIKNAKELRYFINNGSKFQNKYIRLTTDIYIDDQVQWKPVSSSSANKFEGHFDGAGHIIKGNIQNNQEEYDAFGIFGYIENATISNLTVIGNITAPKSSKTGGIVGYMTASSIINCHFNGTISATTESTCTNFGGITAISYGNCTINGCTVQGQINIHNDITQYIGGIVGYLSGQTIIKECYNYAEITGNSTKNTFYIGGIAGQISSTTNNVISDCINYGNINVSVSSPSVSCYCGGLFGTIRSAILNDLANFATDITVNSTYTNKYLGGIAGNALKVQAIRLINKSNITGNTDNRNTYIGGLFGYCDQNNSVHQSRNEGNIQFSDTKSSAMGKIGSHTGYVYQTSYIYSCCSTASDVKLYDQKGNSFSPNSINCPTGLTTHTECSLKHNPLR